MRIHIFWIFFSGYLVLIGLQAGMVVAQSPEVDSLESALEGDLSVADRVPILITLAHQYNRIDLEQAMAYANEALDLATKTDQIGDALLVQGRTFANMGMIDSALLVFRRARTIFTPIKDTLGLTNAFSKLQYAHLHMGNSDSALFFSLEALRYAEAIGSQEGAAVALMKASESLYSQAKFREAIDYALQAAAIAQAIPDSNIIAEAYDDAASGYFLMENYDSALYYLNHTVQIFQALNSNLDLAISLNSRGNAYKLNGQHQLAIQDYERGRQLARPFGFPGLDQALLSNLGDVKIRMGQFGIGLEIMREVLGLTRDLGNRKDQPEVYLHLSKAHAGLGNFDSAYYYRIQFGQLKDSLFTVESDARIAEMQTKYETEKVEAANRLLEQQKQQQSYLLWGALAAIIAVGVIAFLLFRNNRRRKQTNAILSAQKTEIESKNQQNETLLKEIHHRVKNNLQVISSLLRLQTSHIKDDSVRELVAEGEHRVKSMALIHQKLYQRDNLSGIEMKEYLTTLGKSLVDTLGKKGTEIELVVEMAELEVDVDTAVPLGLIANELLTNSLKYAFPGQNSGSIRISLVLNQANLLELTISDNGVGQGTESDLGKGTSFGSKLIQLLCMQMDGEMEVDTSKGRTSRVAVREFEILSS